MLKKTLQTDQVQALKNNEKIKNELLRYILAQIKNKEIEKQEELDDAESTAVMQKIAKELKESIEAFDKGGRTDLVEQNKAQLEILGAYLPKQLSDEELEAEVKKVVEANKDVFDKNPKAIIGVCMKELKSKADSTRIMAILKNSYAV